MIGEQKFKEKSSEEEFSKTTDSSWLKSRYRGCIDSIIWIGQCYPEILCKKTPSPTSTYFYPKNWGRPQSCYVHEAELRGCCRRLSNIFGWMKPGRSRIFLAHWDRYKGIKTRGSLFGYYTPKRFEIITDPSVYETIVNDGKLPWVPGLCDKFITAVTKKAGKYPKSVIQSRARMKYVVRKEFEEKWANRFLRRVSKNLDFRPRTRKKNLFSSSINPGNLPNSIEDLLEELIGEWADMLRKYNNNRKCALVPLDVVKHEPLRSCGDRIKLGAIYAVDDLAAEIIDEFMIELTRRKGLTPQQIRDLYIDIAAHAKIRHSTNPKIDLCGKGDISMRGELALFRDRITYERKPIVYLRNVLRVSGYGFVKEICKCYKAKIGKCIPSVPRCH